MILGKLLYYISKNFLTTLLLISSLIIACILVVSFFEMLNSVRGAIVPFLTILKVSFLKLPHLLGELLPLIIFISVLFTFDKFIKNHEMIIFLVSGINIWRIIFPVLLISLFLSISYITILQPISSSLLNKSETLKRKASNNDTSVLVAKNGLYIFEKIDNSSRVYTANFIVPGESALHNFSVIFLNDKHDFLKKIEAEKAILNNGYMKFEGKMFASDQNGNPIDIKNKIIKTKIDIKTLVNKFTTPEKISFWKLSAISSKLNSSGINSDKYINYYYKLLFNPFYIISIVLLALCFLNLNTRSNSTIKLVGTSSIIGFTIHSFKEILTSFLIANEISSPIAQFIPTIILISIAVSVIFQKFESN